MNQTNFGVAISLYLSNIPCSPCTMKIIKCTTFLTIDRITTSEGYWKQAANIQLIKIQWSDKKWENSEKTIGQGQPEVREVRCV